MMIKSGNIKQKNYIICIWVMCLCVFLILILAVNPIGIQVIPSECHMWRRCCKSIRFLPNSPNLGPTGTKCFLVTGHRSPVVTGYPNPTQRSPRLRLVPHEVTLPEGRWHYCAPGSNKFKYDDLPKHEYVPVGELEKFFPSLLWKGGLICDSWYLIYDKTWLGYFPEK